MYLWNAKALAEDFKADRVTQKEQMKYYLLYVWLFPSELLPVRP